MNIRSISPFALILAAGALSGCHTLVGSAFAPTVRGNGKMKTITLPFKASDIKEIDLSGAVLVEADPSQKNVTFETDENISPKFKFTLKGGVLRGELENGKYSYEKAVIRLSPVALAAIRLSGASSAQITGYKSPELVVELTGASKVDLKGEVKKLKVSASGASKFEISPQTNVAVDLSATGASKIVVPGSLSGTMKASGASKVAHGKLSNSHSISASGASSVEEIGPSNNMP